MPSTTKKRVGIVGLLHESNTFIQEKTTLEHFRNNVLAYGADTLVTFRGSQHEIGGFIESVEGQADFEPVGIMAARAMPYGPISDACWAELMLRLERELRNALPLDGVLVAPHGATVAESAADADGEWLALVRKTVGPNVQIIGTLDLHANVSERMAASCDALFGYRTNPHLDQRDRGVEAGQLMLATLRGQAKPRQKLVQIPLYVNIERQATGEPHGQELWTYADALTKGNRGILSVSCLYGFPYADVLEMGASVLVVGDQPEAPIDQVAQKMANRWWDCRDQFKGHLISIENAINECMNDQWKISLPIGLLDMGDNVGGGSPGDGTLILHHWLLRQSGLPILAVVYDPLAAHAAHKAGLDASIELSVGGNVDPSRHGMPVHGTFKVEYLGDGEFTETGATHGGYSHFNQGKSALLRDDRGLSVLVTSLRVAPLSIQQLLSNGIKTDQFRAIVIKGVHAPIAAYSSYCSRFIRVNTPGVTTADPEQLTYKSCRLEVLHSAAIANS